ncbi:MAG: hypothetical protein J5958_07275, partial [Clostridia bacterium]|nr:hypothetical protein [Clostridia bacterium]
MNNRISSTEILGRNTKVKVQGIPKRNFEKLKKVIEQEKRSGKKHRSGASRFMIITGEFDPG